MSNRARRRWLRNRRLWAVVEDYARMGWDHREDFTTLEDWNRWHRAEFRAIWREPLRFSDNHRPDPGLVTIRIRNSPDRLPGLLDEYIPDECRDSPIWPELASDFEDCGRIFELARQGLKPLKRIRRRRFDWMGWDHYSETWPAWERHARPRPAADAFMLSPGDGCEAEYIAPIRWAARAIRTQSYCLHQHSENFGYLNAAEICLRFPEWMKPRQGHAPRLSAAEILRLIAMNFAFEAADTLVKFAQAIRDKAEAAGIGRTDDDAIDRLRDQESSWERRERRYYGLFLADARELLALADLEANKEAAAGDSHKANSAKGGSHSKKSTGLQSLADALRKERPQASARALFDLALARCAADGAIEIGGFRITATPDGKLVSNAPDGSPDRQPVDYEAWRKNYMGRKR